MISVVDADIIGINTLSRSRQRKYETLPRSPGKLTSAPNASFWPDRWKAHRLEPRLRGLPLRNGGKKRNCLRIGRLLFSTDHCGFSRTTRVSAQSSGASGLLRPA